MIDGVRFSGTAAGIKPRGLDLGIVFFEEAVNVSALYTRNRVKAAHILYDKRIDTGAVRALVVNSGCANACTGKEGVEDLTLLSERLSKLLKVERETIFFASTGVIGRRLPTETIVRALPEAVKSLRVGNMEDFARAIMTTDTYPKVIQMTFQGRKEYRMIGFAKGSGMINPLFATMLAFVVTDYPAEPAALKRPFARAGRETFERISVDGECSTNDTVMLFTRKGAADPGAFKAFNESLTAVMKELALMIVRDGEGATRVVHITVRGAPKKSWAEKIARRIATSPLTKTAFFGCDPNWGRVIAAAGDAGVPLNSSKVEIAVQGHVLAREGMEVPFEEGILKRLMNKKDVELLVDLHDGRTSYDIYTTDLTYDYVKINASYRT
jgi:glutamate N-acetyltransferase/amino-acid N-acetyltransferase